MIRHLPITVALGVGSAVLSVAALYSFGLGVILASLAQTPLFLAGLSTGPIGALVASLAGAAALAFIGGMAFGAIFAVSTALPVVLMVLFALRNRVWTDGQTYWYPIGKLLQLLSLCAALLLIGLAIALSGFGDGFRDSVGKIVSGVANQIAQSAGRTVNNEMLNDLTAIIPGIVAWTWMATVTVNGVFAQAILRRLSKNLRPSPTMQEVEMPPLWGAGFAAAGLAGFVLQGDLGFTVHAIAIILAFPLFIQGLAVVHTYFAYWRVWTIGYVGFYLLVLAFSWLGLGLVALGMAEPMIKLRARIARPTNI